MLPGEENRAGLRRRFWHPIGKPQFLVLATVNASVNIGLVSETLCPILGSVMVFLPATLQ
jgi:hypothetical protein